MYVSTRVSSLFSSNMHTYIHTLTLTYRENIKLFFLKVLVFCQISRVYQAYTNLCYIIVELTLEVLLFAEPQELLFLYICIVFVYRQLNVKTVLFQKFSLA